MALPTAVWPSKRATVTPASALPASATVLLDWMLLSAGLVICGAAGATVSIVQLRLAGVGSVLPARSVARTWKLCPPSARPL